MARDEQALRDYAERTASFMVAAGFPRMPARVLMALTVSDRDGLTASELAEQLSASAAAISGAVRYLQTLAMVRRVSQPGSRRDLYELPHDPWYTASMQKNPMYDQVLSLAASGLDAAGDADDAAHQRITEMMSFFTFIQRRLPEVFDEWREWKKTLPSS
jgi:DNA-binding transcriptional regulator GbsR (MarR family)